MAPLISTHIQDALENEQDIAADLEGSGTIDHVHHHHAHHDSGKHDGDPNDRTLCHHLAAGISAASRTVGFAALNPPYNPGKQRATRVI
jgi:hypothetical protein